ncbi:unnamed protein product [Rhodiola kirilowii]
MSIYQPLSVLNHTHFTISGFRSRNRRISHFQHHCLPIEVASLNQSFRPVAHLYPVRYLPDSAIAIGGSENLVSRRGIWNRRRPVVLSKHGGLGGLEEDEEDRSVELLVRFLQNVFKKISKKARKAVRLVLPVSIPTELVCFSVDGVTMLAYLWLAKAFVEVVCTVGSVVFISILLIHGIWYGISYIQESRTNSMSVLRGEQLWSSARPAM